MARFPTDRFDRLPSGLTRTGAHRGPRRRGGGWITFAWAALATAVLIGAGVVGLAIVNDKLQLHDLIGASGPSSSSATPTPTPSITPTTDPSLSVTILNGTDTEGLAASVTTAMQDAGWDGTGSPASASSTDFQSTTVYYDDPANEAAALGLAQALFAEATAEAADNGVTLSAQAFRTEQSTQFPGAQLTAVLGADFVGPLTAG
jgi:hypothetical protein